MSETNYTLVIRRYGTYRSFDRYEAFVKEVRRHFTAGEQHIVDKLTCFSANDRCPDGHYEKSWQDIITCAYGI